MKDKKFSVQIQSVSMNLSEIKNGSQKLGNKRPSVNLNLSKISSNSKGDLKSARFSMKNQTSPAGTLKN